MIEALFLIIWTALFLLFAYISWMKIAKHSKIYLMILYNWLYLTGIFLIFPELRYIVEHLQTFLR